MPQGDFPHISRVVANALALTGCDGVAAMAGELIAARQKVDALQREVLVLSRLIESNRQLAAAVAKAEEH